MARSSTKVDPTRLLSLRRRFVSLIRVYFSFLRKRVKIFIESHTGKYHKKSSTTSNASSAKDTLQVDDNLAKNFEQWLSGEVTHLEGRLETAIQQMIEEGYKAGASRAYLDAKGKKYLNRISEFHKLLTSLSPNSPTKEFLQTLFSDKATLDKVKVLASKAFTDLQGVNSQVISNLKRVLIEGMIQQTSIKEISTEIQKQLKIRESSAISIAHTELTRAHAEGQLDAMEALGITEVGAAVEWDTAHDSKVCKLCLPLDGIVLRLEEARGLLPRHINCRCAWLPATLKTPLKKDLKRKVTPKLSGQKRAKREVERAIAKSKRAEVSTKRKRKGKERKESKWGPSRISKRN